MKHLLIRYAPNLLVGRASERLLAIAKTKMDHDLMVFVDHGGKKSRSRNGKN